MHETLLRVEHKLDVLIDYLHGMTNVPPRDIPKPVRGGGGVSDGKCPITGSQIRYEVDTESGAVYRDDNLLRGIHSAMPVPAPEPWKTRTPVSEVIDEDLP
jgi:hypothetical protein